MSISLTVINYSTYYFFVINRFLVNVYDNRYFINDLAMVEFVLDRQMFCV